MKKGWLIFIIFISTFTVYSQNGNQVAPGKYWVEFSNKVNTPYQLDNPEEFLSDRAIERRNRQGIEIDSLDLPIDPIFITSLEELGVTVWCTSKWLNGAVIVTNDIDLIDTIENLPYISKLARPNTSLNILDNNTPLSSKENYNYETKSNYYAYGVNTIPQINIHNGQILHNAGFRGQGMLIAIIDAGFLGLNFDFIHAFDSIKENNQIIFQHDYVSNSSIIDVVSTHGMSVLSLIGGNIPDSLIGSAPEADFALIRTEDSQTEHIVEELYWISGAEYADSIGADVVNVSLGYIDFDFPEWNHIPSDFDGNTTYISVATKIASTRGMLLVVAAGNNGSSPPPNLGAPADTETALSVGAVSSDSIYANFSSRGKTYDNRIKPDIMAVGANTYLQLFGSLGPGSGTSFATPIITGLAACLWQAHPMATNQEVADAIKASSDLYVNPNDSMGYGIPNFEIANNILTQSEIIMDSDKLELVIYPNPFNDCFVMQINKPLCHETDISIYNISGQKVYQKNINFTNNPKRLIRINDFRPKSTGVYFIRLSSGDLHYNQKIIKHN